MSLIKLDRFAGEIPRTPPHVLPDNAAQAALNCDFAYGELRGVKEQLNVKTLSVSSARSIWTNDGNGFYAWNDIAEAALSPVVNDTHRRLYYTVGNGVDARVVSMATEPPLSTGKTPAGHKLGVPGPANLNVFGETYSGSGISNSALYARLVNYDTTSTPINFSGYLWTPAIKGLLLRFYVFYEHNGTKYQETEITGIYDGMASPTGTFVSLQQSLKYAGNVANNINERIYGRDFHVSHPIKNFSPTLEYKTIEKSVWNEERLTYEIITTTEPVETTSSTPADAKPVIQVTGFVDGVQAFNVYSDGSAFASTPGSFGAKLYANSVVDGVLYCGLKYGYREARAYVYTNVNIYDEESSPSEPVLVDVGYGQTVELYLTFRQPSWYAPIKSMRTYGTNITTQGNTDWYFVSDGDLASYILPAGTVLSCSGVQQKQPSEYGERLTTQDYDLPPEGATGLCAIPNGFFACFRNTAGGSKQGQNEIYFSEPYRPSAWPAKYVKTLPFDVVGIIPHGSGLVVTTRGNPYYIYGTHPESMSVTKLQAMQAGGAKRAICDAGSHVIYASNDGLVAVQNTDVNINLSQGYFTREVWRERYGAKLAEMALAYHDGMLIGYFTDGVTDGFSIKIDEPARALTRIVAGGNIAHCLSQSDDKLLFSANGSGALFAYAAGSAQQAFTWQSKDYIFPKPISMAILQVILKPEEIGNVTIDVYADGALKQTHTVSTSGDYRLPSGFMARRWSVTISGRRTVKELTLATSAMELANV